MKNILTYGTYDAFHLGHARLLRRAKELGDKLYVGLSTDEFNKIKGKETIFNFEERLKMLLLSGYADLVFEETGWEQKEDDIDRLDIDVLVMGDDWKGRFDDLPCEVKYLKRTPLISTSEIKKRCKNL